MQPCPQARTDTDGTLLGLDQREWLKRSLADSRSTWKLLAITGQPAATEFVGGSITSPGIADQFGGEQRFSDRIREANPHIAYTDTKARGYGIVEARPDELLVTYRSPESVAVRSSPTRTLASFRVAAGSTVVERTA